MPRQARINITVKRYLTAILLAIDILTASAQSGPEEAGSGKIDTLSAARVTSHIEKEIRATQTSLKRMDAKDINRGFALLGTPDVIKSLQMLPGVASGTELLSGFYVRGGDGYDNLFLLDGVPMYQVSHLVGLFSSFNADIVDNLDFYKGGFPARYGGRMSSVVDVTTKEGDFEEFHGSFGIGIIDGRLHLEGPIIKGKTSFSLAVRRTWLDAVTIPVFAIANRRFIRDSLTQQVSMRYDFADYNAKIVHKIAPGHKITAAFYTGDDTFKLKENFTDSPNSYSLPLKWGNTLASLKWDGRAGNGLSYDAMAWWSRYRSDISLSILESYKDDDNDYSENIAQSIISQVGDVGLNANIRWTPAGNHYIRGGISATSHRYNPYYSDDIRQKINGVTTIHQHDTSGVLLHGWEASVFVEDEISLSRRIKANIGFRDAVYGAAGAAWNSFEPRLSASCFINDETTVKASYARMSQYNHQVSTVHLDLPTSTWMPSTAHVRPMTSDQFAAGVYTRIARSLHMSAEAYWKTLNHIYEYNGVATLLPPIHKWDTDFLEGKGRCYGLELEAEYTSRNFYANIGYTLSWSERYFADFWKDWFPDRNDNRHKLTVSANYRFGSGFELYGSWIWHNSCRMTTVTSQVIIDGEVVDAGLFDGPNNLELPPYHRLDLGLNWNKTTRRGNERTWNLSLYNAYCRMNPFFGEIEINNYKKEVYGTAYGIIPIIPTLSYSIRF